LIAIRGGLDGRRASLAIIFAVLATFAANWAYGFNAARPAVLLVDIFLLATVTCIGICSKFYWPIWFCGFQAISVASGMAGLIFPTQLPLLYANFSGFWALPALGAAVVGILLDRRALNDS